MAGNIAMENGPFVGDSKNPVKMVIYYIILFIIILPLIIS